MPKLEWKRAYPHTEGFFFYRVNMSEPTEVVECYLAGRSNGQHRYGWSDKKLLLGKRMHDPEAVTADELSGFYLVAPGDKDPTPIEIIEAKQTVAAPKKKAQTTDLA